MKLMLLRDVQQILEMFISAQRNRQQVKEKWNTPASKQRLITQLRDLLDIQGEMPVPERNHEWVLIAHLKEEKLYVGLNSDPSKQGGSTVFRERIKGILSDGTVISDVTGWTQEAFLRTLAFFLLRRYARIACSTEEDTEDKARLPYLAMELWTAVNAYRITAELSRIHSLDPAEQHKELEQFGTFLTTGLLNFLADPLNQKIKASPFLCIPSGFPGHAMYLNVVWLREHFYLRWDNRLKDTCRYHGVAEGNPIPGVILSTFTSEQLKQPEIHQALCAYFTILGKVSIRKPEAYSQLERDKCAKNLKQLYNCGQRLSLPEARQDVPWPSQPAQMQDTCVFANYWAGMVCRHGDTETDDRKFLVWLRLALLKDAIGGRTDTTDNRFLEYLNQTREWFENNKLLIIKYKKAVSEDALLFDVHTQQAYNLWEEKYCPQFEEKTSKRLLFSQSTSFISKRNFVKYIICRTMHSVIHISGPSGFGKTTNLCYLQNYYSSMGCITIKLNFSKLRSQSYTEFEQDLKDLLFTSLQELRFDEKLQDIIKQFNPIRIKSALENLITTLIENGYGKIVVFIDSYDMPFLHIRTPEDHKKVKTFLSVFFTCCKDVNTDATFVRTFIFSFQNAPPKKVGSSSFGAQFYDFLEDEKYFGYFGFLKEEVDEKQSEFTNININTDQIFDYCGGYICNEKEICNPRYAVTFFHAKQTEKDDIKKMLDNNEHIKEVLKIIEKEGEKKQNLVIGSKIWKNLPTDSNIAQKLSHFLRRNGFLVSFIDKNGIQQLKPANFVSDCFFEMLNEKLLKLK